MPRQYRKSLYIFRRDLRLEDNSALIAALRQSESVLTLFVADKQLLRPERQFANGFLASTLVRLQQQIGERGGELCLLAGDALACIEDVIVREKIDAVFINRDYTPYAKKRDEKLRRLCEGRNLVFNCYADQLLLEPEQALKKDATPYTVFTPFFRNAGQFSIAAPQPCPKQGFSAAQHLKSLSIVEIIPEDGSYLLDAGSDPAKNILSAIKNFGEYENQRNFPALGKTTQLSPHLKFGTCSVRQVYHRVKNTHGSGHGLIRELFWRDFFTHIAWHFPHVFGRPFRPQYQQLHWSQADDKFAAWCEGRTGYPIVDAGMRQLNATGFMHGRLRMIVASFLVKHLQIDWRRGEAYFRKKLLDYDPCVNNGNWQWSASTGCDAQPWFRIFNPWLQQKKFDPDCIYIKEWIPALRMCDKVEIHNSGGCAQSGYPAPIVDHAIAVAQTRLMYSAV